MTDPMDEAEKPLTAEEEKLLRFSRSIGGIPVGIEPAQTVDRLLATLDAAPAAAPSDPDSPQWEACKVCGGDHWTKDHHMGGDFRAGAALTSALMAANYPGDSGEDVDRLMAELAKRGYAVAPKGWLDPAIEHAKDWPNGCPTCRRAFGGAAAPSDGLRELDRLLDIRIEEATAMGREQRVAAFQSVKGDIPDARKSADLAATEQREGLTEAWGRHAYIAGPTEDDTRCRWTDGRWSACKAGPDAPCHAEYARQPAHLDEQVPR